jgi:hypothetical protein
MMKRACGVSTLRPTMGQVAVRAELNASDWLILNPPIGLVDGMRVATAFEAWLAGGGRADHGLVE